MSFGSQTEKRWFFLFQGLIYCQARWSCLENVESSQFSLSGLFEMRLRILQLGLLNRRRDTGLNESAQLMKMTKWGELATR
jgi:hypothetical protein